MSNDRNALSSCKIFGIFHSIHLQGNTVHPQIPSLSSNSAEVVRSCSNLDKMSRLWKITLPLVATAGSRSRLALALRQCCDYCLQPWYEVIRVNPCFKNKRFIKPFTPQHQDTPKNNNFLRELVSSQCKNVSYHNLTNTTFTLPHQRTSVAKSSTHKSTNSIADKMSTMGGN